MQVGVAGDRSDLAIAEHPGNRHLLEGFTAEIHIAIRCSVEAFAATEAGKQQGGQGVGRLGLLLGQELPEFLAGGLRIAQLELHLLAHPHALGHGHGSVARVHADQVAHEEGAWLGGLGAVQVEVAAPHPKEEGVLDQLPLLGAEVGEDRLQGCHRAAAVLALAHFQHHIALGLFDVEYRSDGPAALGYDRVELPGAADQAADGTPDNLVAV